MWTYRVPIYLLSALALTALIALATATAKGAAQPGLGGSYRCQPDPDACQWSGQSFTVTQQNALLQVKSDKGDTGNVQVTSAVTLSAGPPWNMVGVVAPDRSIEWSNGTKWLKQ